MLDPLAAPDTRQDLGLLAAMVRGDDHGDRVADGLGGGVAEEPFGATVPALDDAVQVLADDGVVGGFDNGGES